MNDKRKNPKSHRIQIVLDVLERFGRSNRDSILLRVANSLDENKDSESFQRAIYRDLEDLEVRGEIKADYFHRDGSLIDDFDPDSHKNYYKEWFIPSAEGKISGAGNLEKLNGLIYVPKILKNEFAIVEGQHSPDPKHRHLYFQIGSKFICLKGTFDAIEFTIALSRIHGDILSTEIDEIEKSLGKRTIILKVPYSKLSSYKPKSQLANNLIRVSNNSEFELINKGSKNPLIVYQLTTKEADELRSRGAMLDEETMTSTWRSLRNSMAMPNEVKDSEKFKVPALLEIADNFKVLII